MLGSVGCGRKSAAERRNEAAAERIVANAMRMATGQKTDVDVDGGTVRFSSEDGDVVISGGDGAKLPKSFPKDIPVYKGASVLQSAVHNETEFSVTLQTKDSMRKVADYYRSTMKSKGWTEEQVLDTGNQSIQAYTKGDQGANVMVMKGEEQTVITMAVGENR